MRRTEAPDIPDGLWAYTRKRTRSNTAAAAISRFAVSILRARGFTDEQIATFPKGWRVGRGPIERAPPRRNR
jgi:hypothetical protein